MLSFKTILFPVLLLAGQCMLALAEDDPTFLNTVYLIRNAETNTKTLGSGLSPAGQQRSQCLPIVCLSPTAFLLLPLRYSPLRFSSSFSLFFVSLFLFIIVSFLATTSYSPSF